MLHIIITFNIHEYFLIYSSRCAHTQCTCTCMSCCCTSLSCVPQIKGTFNRRSGVENPYSRANICINFASVLCGPFTPRYNELAACTYSCRGVGTNWCVCVWWWWWGVYRRVSTDDVYLPSKSMSTYTY